MPFTYDNGLVMLSVGAVIFGAFTALVMTAGIRFASEGIAKFRLVLAALTLGLGAWAMHFIGLLAVELPVRISFDAAYIIAAAALAIILSMFAFFVSRAQSIGDWSLPLGAIVMGGGFAGMFYLGVASIRGGVEAQHSWFAVIITVAIAIQAAVIALWLAFRRRGVFLTLAGTLGLGLTISAMHYGAMESISFAPSPSLAGVAIPEFSEISLAWTAAVVLYLLCSLCLAVYALFQFLSETK